MKIKSVRKKLPVFIIASLLVIVLGIVAFFTLGFNSDARFSNGNKIVVTYDSFINISDKNLEEVESTALGVIEKSGFKVEYEQKSTTTAGGKIEYNFASSVDGAKLKALASDMLRALNNNEKISQSEFTCEAKTSILLSYPVYGVRNGIICLCAVVLAFAYVAIRFKLGAGITIAVVAIHDVLVTVALALITRVAIGATFPAAVFFAAVYSIILSAITFAHLRKGFKNENIKVMEQGEAQEVLFAETRKTTLIVSAMSLIAVVIVGAFSVISSVSVLSFIIPFLFPVAASCYSNLFLLPGIYLPLKESSDKRAAEKAVTHKAKKSKGKKAAEKTSKEDID